MGRASCVSICRLCLVVMAKGSLGMRIGVVREVAREEEKLLAPGFNLPVCGSFKIVRVGESQLRLYWVESELDSGERIYEAVRNLKEGWTSSNMSVEGAAGVYPFSNVNALAWDDQVRVWYQTDPNTVSEITYDGGDWSYGGIIDLFDEDILKQFPADENLPSKRLLAASQNESYKEKAIPTANATPDLSLSGNSSKVNTLANF